MASFRLKKLLKHRGEIKLPFSNPPLAAVGMNIGGLNYADHADLYYDRFWRCRWWAEGWGALNGRDEGWTDPVGTAKPSRANTSSDGLRTLAPDGNFYDSIKMGWDGTLYSTNSYDSLFTTYSLRLPDWIEPAEGVATTGPYAGKQLLHIIAVDEDGNPTTCSGVTVFTTSECVLHPVVTNQVWDLELLHAEGTRVLYIAPNSIGAKGLKFRIFAYRDDGVYDFNRVLTEAEAARLRSVGDFIRALNLTSVNSDGAKGDTARSLGTRGPGEESNFFGQITTAQVVKAANEAGVGLWMPLGHRLTLAAIDTICAQLATVNHPICIAECSNEIWNSGFQQWFETQLLGLRAGYDVASITKSSDAVPRTVVSGGSDTITALNQNLSAGEWFFAPIKGIGTLAIVANKNMTAGVDALPRDGIYSNAKNATTPVVNTYLKGHYYWGSAAGQGSTSQLYYCKGVPQPDGSFTDLTVTNDIGPDGTTSANPLTNTTYWRVSTAAAGDPWSAGASASACTRARIRWAVTRYLYIWQKLDAARAALSLPRSIHAWMLQVGATADIPTWLAWDDFWKYEECCGGAGYVGAIGVSASYISNINTASVVKAATSAIAPPNGLWDAKERYAINDPNVYPDGDVATDFAVSRMLDPRVYKPVSDYHITITKTQQDARRDWYEKNTSTDLALKAAILAEWNRTTEDSSGLVIRPIKKRVPYVYERGTWGIMTDHPDLKTTANTWSATKAYSTFRGSEPTGDGLVPGDPGTANFVWYRGGDGINRFYMCIQDGNLNKQPDISPTYWKEVAGCIDDVSGATVSRAVRILQKALRDPRIRDFLNYHDQAFINQFGAGYVANFASHNDMPLSSNGTYVQTFGFRERSDKVTVADKAYLWVAAQDGATKFRALVSP